MARRIRKWLTPDSFVPSEECRIMRVPHWSLWSYVDGALAPLTELFNWEQFGDMTPAEMSELFSEVLQNFSEECMNCDELKSCLYGTNQQFRMNPVTGELESSSDGGETWETNTESDPRLISPRIGLDGDFDCDHARFIVGGMQQWVDQIKDVITAGSGIVGLTAAGVTIAAGILSVGTLTPLFVGLGSAVLGFSVAAIDAALTSAVWERLVCNIYCVLDGVTEVTAAHVEEIKAQIVEDETDIAETILWNVVNFWGAVGLQNWASMRVNPASVPEDCDDCDCDDIWCYEFTFSEGQQDWTITFGFWSAAKSFYSYWDGSKMFLEINRTYADTVITRVVVTGTMGRDAVTAPTRQFNSWKDGAVTVLGALPTAAGDYSVEWTGTLASDRLQLRADSNSATAVQENRFYTVRIEGTGVNPFGDDNCEG